jgi:CBS domain containing-hemolysin-like protein
MLIGNNISIVILTFLFSEILDPFVLKLTHNDIGILFIETMIITVFILIFAEFLPKSIFRAYSNEMMSSLAYPIYLFKIILRIPTLVFTSLSTVILKYIFKTKVIEDDIQLTRVDLEHFIDENITEEDDIEKEMFQKALKLDQLKARDIMIPRTEIIAIDKSATKEELIRLFTESKHSRIIIFDGDIENVLGYIHHQQLIREDFKKIENHIIPVPFTPETMNARNLLLTFIKDAQNISIIVDEYGSIAGLITLEDLIEEIFGEIEDEYDKEDTIEKKINDNEFLFSGRLEIDDINENYKLHIPEGEYNTLSGFLVTNLGKIPRKGDEFIFDDYKFKIIKVSKKKVELIKVIVLEDHEKD